MKATAIVLAAIILIGIACGSESGDVATLEDAGGDTEAAATGNVVNAPVDDEAAVMAFTECMRERGIEYKDPVVDTKGNVQRPVLVDGATYTRAELADPYRACSTHLEGLTFGRERRDVVEAVDQLVELTTCLRDKGHDVDDPTIETLEQWRADFRVEFNWSDPDAAEAYRTCNETTGGAQ